MLKVLRDEIWLDMDVMSPDVTHKHRCIHA